MKIKFVPVEDMIPNEMPSKGPFEFKRYLKQRMKKLIKLSNENNKEYGFTLCIKSGNNILRYRGCFEGNEDHVPLDSIKNLYKKGEIQVGTFHAHQGRDDSTKLSSIGDLLGMYNCNESIMCIGFLENSQEKVICYQPKKEYDSETILLLRQKREEQENIRETGKILKTKRITNPKRNEEIKQYEQRRNRLIDFINNILKEKFNFFDLEL